MSAPDPRIQSGGGWIQTVTGRAFPILDPRPEDFDIRDIAHALSMLCRFGGHTREFYSVAQHSVLVSVVLERFQPENRALHLLGLLHDAAEAYVVDLPRPIKRMAGLEAYRQAETVVEWAIRERFGLSAKVPDILAVKVADEMLLRTECRDLMGPLHPAWTRELHPDHGTTMPEVIVPLAPAAARDLFLRRWAVLWRGVSVLQCQGFDPAHAVDPVMVEAHHLSHAQACDAGAEIPYRDLGEQLRCDVEHGFGVLPISNRDVDLLVGNCDDAEDADDIAACGRRYPATVALIEALF